MPEYRQELARNYNNLGILLAATDRAQDAAHYQRIQQLGYALTLVNWR